MLGIGLRREIAQDIHRLNPQPEFLELAPENWMGIGGFWGKLFAEIAEKYPLTAHGLSLSIGSPDPINWEFLKKIKAFLDEHQIEIYSEHLSFSTCDNAHLYESLPLPFTDEAVRHISKRIREVQDAIERPLVLENITYYTVLDSQLSEVDFINAILEESNCELLLDVNNIYVNGQNHGYDPNEFLSLINLDAVSYVHIGGHQQTPDGLILDTHNNKIIDPVYELFESCLPKLKSNIPILLERDANFEAFEELNLDLSRLHQMIPESNG